MNFTREPIIETVISPREGCRLVIRSSKGVGQEDYYVDAIEVVSFGNALFFRSIERPKSFLVPVSDYEVIELKETRMVLKTAGLEKSIKIKDTSPRPMVKANVEKPTKQTASEKKRERKKSKKRKASLHKEENKNVAIDLPPPPLAFSSDEIKENDGAAVSTSIIKKIFPPPSKLIKENLSRYKSDSSFEEEILSGEGVDQEEFLFEENTVTYSLQPDFSGDFQKSIIDPEVMEEVQSKEEEKKEE